MSLWQVVTPVTTVLLVAAIGAWVVTLPFRVDRSMRDLLILSGVFGVTVFVVGLAFLGRAGSMMTTPFESRRGLIAAGIVLLLASILAWAVRLRAGSLSWWVRVPLTLGGALAGAYGIVTLVVVLSPGG